jgi:CDP-diacylglycerol pyrophosphatase
MNRPKPFPRVRRRVAWLALLAAGLAGAWVLAVHGADRDALRHIVQDQCLPHWKSQHDPRPCASLTPGFAVLADRKGGAHFLLIATATVPGIEAASVLAPDAPNYFEAAWQARDRLSAVVGHPLRRDSIGLAINSARARGQDQLHIHIECQQPQLRQYLRSVAAEIGEHWSLLRSPEYPFLAMRVRGAALQGVNPFALLADGEPAARADMAAYTMVVAATEGAEGPGFILLAGRTAEGPAALLPPAPGLVPPGETLLDSTCVVDTSQGAASSP